MIPYTYLTQGLNALARAHTVRSSMAGHLGAALIAGYFVGERHPDLDEAVVKGMTDDLERVKRGQSVFGTKRKTKDGKSADAALFEPFPKQKPNASLIDGIAEALGKNIHKPRQSGHNVIFASLAIHALKEHPELATPAVTDGVRKLIAKFDNAHPGSGYYGKARGRLYGHKINLPEAGEEFPPFTGLASMAETVADTIVKQDAKVHRQGYGGLVHVTNHAAALIDLAQCGYKELARRGLPAHRHHLRLWLNLPNLRDELGPVKVATHVPYVKGYWTGGKVPYDRALLTHRVKTMFGFDEVAELVEEKTLRERAYDKLRLMM